MTKTKRIRVLRRDIENGRIGNCRLCPVALATRRARIMPLSNIDVGGGTLDFAGQWKVPAEVIMFIDAFDNGLPVQPFSFLAKLDDWREFCRTSIKQHVKR